MTNGNTPSVGGYDWINRAAWTERYRISQIGPNQHRRQSVRSVRHEDSVGETGKGSTNGKLELFDLNVMNAADEIVRTVISKQKDYGPSNIRKSPYGPIPGLAVRLYDKVARLANLSGGKEPSNESLRDTFVDIAGYGIIGLMILDETFPKE